VDQEGPLHHHDLNYLMYRYYQNYPNYLPNQYYLVPLVVPSRHHDQNYPMNRMNQNLFHLTRRFHLFQQNCYHQLHL
jgi:hypothetical protein